LSVNSTVKQILCFTGSYVSTRLTVQAVEGSGSQILVRVLLVVHEGFQGGTRTGLLSVFLDEKIYIYSQL